MRIKWTDEKKKKQNSKKMQKARTQTRLHIQFLSIVIECEIFREAKHFFFPLSLSLHLFFLLCMQRAIENGIPTAEKMQRRKTKYETKRSKGK